MSDPPRWEANQTGIAYLLGNHRLEHIQASVDAARGLVQQAALHLQSARTLAETSDHSMAFIAAYDAARKYPDFDTPGVTAEDVASAIPAAESIVQLAGAYLASLPD